MFKLNTMFFLTKPRVPNLVMSPAMQPYQRLLLDELQRRKVRNARYSLRAFSRHLNISPALLSLLIQGKQRLSAKTAGKIALHLGLSESDARRLLNPQVDTDVSQPSKKHLWSQLSADEFYVVADWYHYAILALADYSHNSADIKWISSQIGLPAPTVRRAYDRLKKLGYIVETKSGFRQVKGPLTTSTNIPSSAIRRHHRQNLHRAEDALETVDVAERFFSSFTIAITGSDYPAAIEEIARFQRRLSSRLNKGTKKDATYTFSAQFFPNKAKTKKPKKAAVSS